MLCGALRVVDIALVIQGSGFVLVKLWIELQLLSIQKYPGLNPDLDRLNESQQPFWWWKTHAGY